MKCNMQHLFHFNQVSKKLTEEVNIFIYNWTSSEKLIELFTSGSTSEPKSILADKKMLVESARVTGDFFDFNPNMKMLLCLPLQYIGGKMMLVRAIVHQMNTYITQPENPFSFDDKLSIDFCAMTPYQYEKALNLNKDKLLKIKTVLLGGGAISALLENKIAQNNQQVYHSYGMTETYSHVAMRKVNGQNEPFQALKDITFSITDDKCLVIHAPRIGVKQLITNDIIELINDKQFYFLGRKDFVVNSGGIKLHPELLEKKIAPKMKDVRYFFCGLTSEVFGEELVLFVESEDSSKPYDLASLLTKYERPKKIIFQKVFKNTDSGKINRLDTIKSYLCP